MAGLASVGMEKNPIPMREMLDGESQKGLHSFGVVSLMGLWPHYHQ